MKNAATLAGVTLLTLASFSDARPVMPVGNHAGQLVDALLIALQRQSTDAFAELFPTLTEFHDVMELNRGFYGKSLDKAREDFARVYNDVLVPELRKSFARVLGEGKALGIDWGSIELPSWELTPSNPEATAFQLVMRIQSGGDPYTLVVEKILVIHDRVHVSSAVRIG